MTITRDRHGIPHVSAGSLVDLAREQGRMTGADRGRQLDLDRRHAEGRVAEVAGPVAVAWDRFARQVGLAALGERAYARLGDEARRFVDAYADGVREALPDWRPASSLAVFAVHHITFGAFPGKLWRAHVADRLGDDWVDRFPVETGPASGSNAWMMGGARTASGLPLIGGDPHRLLESPGCYQQVRLSCPGVDVVGFTFPGVPGVQHFAHAGEVAWAITNAMADTHDLFVEQLRRVGDRVEALGPEGWEPTESWTETIDVLGGGQDVVEIVVTPRGPLVVGDVDAGEGFSLRTPPLVDGDLGLDVLPDLLLVRSVAELDAVLDRWVEPVNNVLMADRSGRMRYRVAGRIPVRNPAARHRPVPAWVPTHAWTGYVADLPAHDVTDVETTANERRGPESVAIGHEFAAPHRAARLRELIAARDVWSAADAPLLHGDTLLPTADRLVGLFAGCEPTTERARHLLDELSTWDRHMDAVSAGAAVHAALRSALVRRLVTQPPLDALAAPPRLSSPLFAPWLNHHGRVAGALDQWLQHPPPGLDLAAAAASALVDVAAADVPADWGSTHRFLPAGAPHVALSGDTDCLCAAGSTPGVTDRVAVGPAARYVWDLDDRDVSAWIVPLGAHDDPDHPHHHDQLAHWAAGRLLTITEETR